MPQNYDKVDCFWSSRGDFILSEGDVFSTEYDPLRSLNQEVVTRLESDQGDWVVFHSTGANLRDFVGEPNNAYVAEAIKVRMHSSLTRDGFINNQDIKIMTMPIDADKLLVRLNIKVAPTARNGNSRSLVINAVYNYSDNNVYFR